MLQIVLAHTANPSYERISLLNGFKKVENKYLLTAKKNYSNSEHLRTLSEETQFTSSMLSTSHSIAMKQGTSRSRVSMGTRMIHDVLESRKAPKAKYRTVPKALNSYVSIQAE